MKRVLCFGIYAILFSAPCFHVIYLRRLHLGGKLMLCEQTLLRSSFMRGEAKVVLLPGVMRYRLFCSNFVWSILSLPSGLRPGFRLKLPFNPRFQQRNFLYLQQSDWALSHWKSSVTLRDVKRFPTLCILLDVPITFYTDSNQ